MNKLWVCQIGCDRAIEIKALIWQVLTAARTILHLNCVGLFHINLSCILVSQYHDFFCPYYYLVLLVYITPPRKYINGMDSIRTTTIASNDRDRVCLSNYGAIRTVRWGEEEDNSKAEKWKKTAAHSHRDYFVSLVIMSFPIADFRPTGCCCSLSLPLVDFF